MTVLRWMSRLRPDTDGRYPDVNTPRKHPVHGLLYVDKPAGITSHDVVAVVRRAARSRRVGHAGTLDPFATGLLVLGIGKCTRLLPYIVGEPKVYETVVRFGSETNTDDLTGSVVREADAPRLDASAFVALHEALASLTGSIEQRPPAFSAKHVDGERAYAIARRGVALELPPVSVVVHGWEVLGVDGPRLHARITCAGGTYVRALARDLGRALGSAAHCEILRRISSGPASVTRAVTLERLTPGAIADGVVELQSPLVALGDIATERLDASMERDLAQGRAIAATTAGTRVAFLRTSSASDGTTGHPDEVLGIGVREGDRWQPRVVFLGADA